MISSGFLPESQSKTEFSEEMFGDNAVIGSSPGLGNEHTKSAVRDAPDWVFWVRLCLLTRSGMEKLTSCAAAASVRLPAGVQTHADMP